MQIRKPIVAGQFYPGTRNLCMEQINEFIEQITPNEALPESIAAGIVPHAGWAFSGLIAELVFSAVKQQHESVDTFVIFGAAHGYFGPVPAVYDKGVWLTPLGEVIVDEDMADVVLGSGLAISDFDAHRTEHSIEVQLPFIQHLFGDAKILPILVPPGGNAISLGETVADIITSDQEKKIICIASTDLTHYGPNYGFLPMGTGKQALQWASEVNDKQFIDLALELNAEALLASAAENSNACGPGAAAAAVAAAAKLGKTQGLLLAHTDSNKIMAEKTGTSSADSVGYAAIVF